MLEFYKPEIRDRDWIQSLLSASGGMGSQDAFGTLFIWAGKYHTRICLRDDLLFTRYGKESYRFGFPVSTKNGEALYHGISLLIQNAEELGMPLHLWGMTAVERDWLDALFPGRFRFTSTPDDSDYLYDSRDLAELAGRKYHSKRNHIARFRRQYDYSYEPVTADNLSDCEAVAREWCHLHGCGGELRDENCAIVRTLRHYDDLHFRGGLIRIEGKPVAFTMGEEINPEVFDVHFEKALDGYDGLYPTINQEFAARELTGYRLINREEDMGIPGLRKAKQSYYPAILLEKFSAELVSPNL